VLKHESGIAAIVTTAKTACQLFCCVWHDTSHVIAAWSTRRGVMLSH
jgi:hypothetical protein